MMSEITEFGGAYGIKRALYVCKSSMVAGVYTFGISGEDPEENGNLAMRLAIHASNRKPSGIRHKYYPCYPIWAYSMDGNKLDLRNTERALKAQFTDKVHQSLFRAASDAEVLQKCREFARTL